MVLLGNFGQQLDIGDLEHAAAEMQRAILENQRVDLDQAKAIAALRSENHDLKLYLAMLMRLLVARGVLKPEEVEATVKAIETN